MLGEYVQSAGCRGRAVLFARGHAFDRGLALQQLEPVGGNQDGVAGLIQPVVRPPDALQQAGNALGRTDLDHLVYTAPIDAEIERAGRHHRPQRARRHRGLHLATLGDVQAAMMQADRQGVGIEFPHRLKQQLALGAGVDEHDRHAGVLDAV